MKSRAHPIYEARAKVSEILRRVTAAASMTTFFLAFNRRDTAPTQSGFAEIISDDFPGLDVMSSGAPFRRIPWLTLTGFSAWARQRVFGNADHSGADRTSDRAGAARE